MRKLLPATPPEPEDAADMDTDDVHEAGTLHEVDDIEKELKSRANLGKGTGSEAYDSDDDDDHPRGQRVQCAQS